MAGKSRGGKTIGKKKVQPGNRLREHCDLFDIQLSNVTSTMIKNGGKRKRKSKGSHWQENDKRKTDG